MPLTSINEPGAPTRDGVMPASINEAGPLPPMLNKLTPASIAANATPGASFILNASGAGIKTGDVIVLDGVDLATDYLSPTLLRAMQAPFSALPKTVDAQIRRGGLLSNVLKFQFKP